MSKTSRVTTAGTVEGSQPDLQTQLEDLLNQVWVSEKEWRLDDRIALAVALEGRG